MKITHDKVGQNLNLTDTRKLEKSDKSKAGKIDEAKISDLDKTFTPDAASTVNLSERAQDIKRSKEIALAAPDIREDRVAELQKLIDTGKYKVDAKELANKMVDEEAQWS